MTDIVDSATRRRMMQGIRGRDTQPEIRLRKALFARGFRYRKNVRSLHGTPDIVLPRYRAAIFVHGCFWHGHDCHLFRLPATRTDFWREKIETNQARDERAIDLLQGAGWRVLTVWECAFRGKTRPDFNELVDSVVSWLKGSSESGDIQGNNHGLV